MAMTLEQARQAIVEHMMSFNGIAQERIQYPNAPDFNVPKEGLWCRLNIMYGRSFISGLADKPSVRRTGIINIQCFMRLKTGTKEMSILNTELLEHFEFYTIDHLEFLEGEATFVGTSNDFDMYNVVVDFRLN